MGRVLLGPKSVRFSSLGVKGRVELMVLMRLASGGYCTLLERCFVSCSFSLASLIICEEVGRGEAGSQNGLSNFADFLAPLLIPRAFKLFIDIVLLFYSLISNYFRKQVDVDVDKALFIVQFPSKRFDVFDLDFFISNIFLPIRL